MEIDTPSWNTETREPEKESVESEVMPRITKPGLFGDWSWTVKPGVNCDRVAKSWTPRASSRSEPKALSAMGTSRAFSSRFWAVTISSSTPVAVVSSCAKAAVAVSNVERLAAVSSERRRIGVMIRIPSNLNSDQVWYETSVSGERQRRDGSVTASAPAFRLPRTRWGATAKS